jgi:hypothetical protein
VVKSAPSRVSANHQGHAHVGRDRIRRKPGPANQPNLDWAAQLAAGAAIQMRRLFREIPFAGLSPCDESVQAATKRGQDVVRPAYRRPPAVYWALRGPGNIVAYVFGYPGPYRIRAASPRNARRYDPRTGAFAPATVYPLPVVWRSPRRISRIGYS